MSNTFKIKKLIFLFFLFSFINNKEFIEEWENNTQNIYESFENSSPLSLVVNNLTNTTLYLYSDNIYIVNETSNEAKIIENKENLKSIDSLIEFNETYYICSSSGLFQIINDDNLIKIDISEDIHSLKCFYFQNGEQHNILIGLIGSNRLLNYDLINEKLVKYNYNEGNLIDINCYGIDTTKPIFAIISKDNDKYILKIDKYENGNFNNMHISYLSNYIDFQNDLNIKISFLSDKIIIILIYISKQEFNFYHFDFGSNELKLVGGKNLLRSFKGYDLINANFIENTPMIYYLITKNGRFYLGVADLQYYIILYNIEIPKEVNIFYEQGYFYQSKGFLNYFENNIHRKICPFVSYSNQCYYKLKDKNFVISKEYTSFGLYQNYFSDSCVNGQIIGHYCLEQCPIYSWYSGLGSCSICQYNYFFNYVEKKCNVECKYNSEYKICYDCEKNNKIFYNNDCIDHCSDVYKIYNEDTKTCIGCGEGQYFNTQNNECTSQCPEDSEKDETNKVCYDCKKFGMFFLRISEKNSLCYRKCPFFYYPDNSSKECKLCENGYYKNGVCVNDCGEGYNIATITINEKSINYCISCKDEGKVYSNGKCIETCNEDNLIFEQNGICVENCGEGYTKNNETQKCESCLEKGLYYYGGICSEHCSDFGQYLAWDETDHICKKCEDSLYFEDNKCVTQCKDYSKKSASDKICFSCPTIAKYYSNGGCYAQCPEYTVPNKIEEYCSFCSDDRIFFNNKCIKECKEPYRKVETQDRHYICQKCQNNEYYTSDECKEKCENNSYKLEEDKSCHLCFCNSKGTCKNNSTYECNCELNNDIKYFGKSCEFSTKLNTKYVEIKPLDNKALKTNSSFYGFNIKKEGFNKYTIKWEYFLGKKEITSDPEYKKYFITGNKENIFGINPNLISEDKNNYLHLTLIDENNIKLEDEIKIYAQKFEITSEHKVGFLDPKLQDTGYLYKAMKTKIEIDQTQYSNMNQYKFYYQFSFLDGYNEEIPLTDFINDRTIETYYIPFAKQYLVTMRSDRGEIKKYEIKKDDSDIYQNYNNDDFISKPIEDIIGDSNYNDIEKIFIFMVIFNSKERKLNEGELKPIFEYLNSTAEHFINEKGYNITNNNETIINYSEPKLIFALINSIIISQKKIFDYENITTIYKCLNYYANLLNNKNIKLSSKDVISLIRTIEQLHIVYNEYIGKTKNTTDIPPLNFNNLYGNINNYLSLNLYPGEGIKIIGNRTILFSYNLGDYQDILAISSNNLTSPANISNLNTYSYQNYGLNEENCTSGTFLCINKDIYGNIKPQINDIKNTSLNIYIVNNIRNSEINNNNNNDNYLVSLQFYDLINKKKIDLTIDDKYFYYLEFYYKNEKKKINSELVNDKDNIFYMPYNYSNVFCYPKNHEKSSQYYCFTYFDYLKNIIQCKCNIIDEISIIEDKELAKFYKSLQFQTVNYTYTNIVTREFIIIFLILLLIPGLLFLLYDIWKVNKYIKNKHRLDIKEKRREYYNEVKIYTNAKLTFPIYSTFNKFPYCAAFNACHYTSPKYIKHLIVITAILLGFILNLIPFYFTLPFEEKQILIDKRDINIDEKEIHSIRFLKNYLIRGFIYALISLIIVHLFILLFNKILKIDKKNIKYWKDIKDLFKDYVYFEIKKKRYFGKNFERIKNRMKAFYFVCGRYLLNKNIMNHPDRNKKLENYLKYTGKLNKNNLSISNNKIEIKDDSKLKDNKIGTNKESLLYELPQNNIINDDENTLIKSQYNPPKVNINIKMNLPVDKNSMVDSSFGINQKNKLGDILIKLKPIKTDNFRMGYVIDNKLGLTNNTIQHLEKINNKYANGSKININSLKKKNIQAKESPLGIYYNINLSLFNEMSYQECDKNNNSRETKLEFTIIILMTFILGIIFSALIFLSISIIHTLLNEYEYFMVKIWLLCTILILFVAYFLIYFLRILIGSILLFNFYPKRKRGCFIKCMFAIFVDKSLIYMYKIRNYITKYRRDFINI